MEGVKVADLRIEEFRELVREIVVQALSEALIDPDQGLELREEFVEELQRSLATSRAGGKTLPAREVAERLGLGW
jgi:signal recognition particle GTPase